MCMATAASMFRGAALCLDLQYVAKKTLKRPKGPGYEFATVFGARPKNDSRKISDKSGLVLSFVVFSRNVFNKSQPC